MGIYTTLCFVSLVLGALSPGYSFELQKKADAIVTELRPSLSPGASILLPADDPALFANLTKRHTALANPDITAIVRVGAGSDVPQIIKYARRKGRAFLAGSGRHGWAKTLSNAHDAIMIDIATLTQINIDASRNTMTVGGGVKIGDVMATLQAAGKETATGICDCVGFLGATLGGGHGRLQGLHGLMADNLISVKLATSTGKLLTVSKTSYPDLFWGLRGAGHNFGVVTEAVYRIYNQTNGGLQFNANVIYSVEQLEPLFNAMNNFEPPAGTNVLVSFFPQPNALPRIGLSFVASNPAETAIFQLDSAFGHISHISRTQGMVPWDKVNSLGLLGVGRTACVGTDRRNPSGVSMTHYDIPTIAKAYESFRDFTVANPTAATTMMLFESYSVKGVQAVPAADTAYPHREETSIALLTASYPEASTDAAGQAWLNNVTSILHAGSGFEKPAVYMNYAQGTEGFGALYGYEKWRQARLISLKRKYDSECAFGWYHPIPCS